MNQSEIYPFKKGSVVYTSRGRFATIISSNIKKSIVKIGNKEHEISNNDLIPANKAISIDVHFVKDKFTGETDIKLIHVPSHIVAFDFNNPLNNNLVTICEKHLEAELKYKPIITLIKIV